MAKLNGRTQWNFKNSWQLYLLLLPATLLGLLFNYGPLMGVVMAFQDFKPWLGIQGSPWIGMENFSKMMDFEESRQAIRNTVVISSLKIVFQIMVPLVFALLLNEVKKMLFKRTIQTLVYLPHFLSWVILGAILLDILSVDGGIVNQALGLVGAGPIFFLGQEQWFLITVIVSDVWKEFGFATIIFLAALSNVNPELYEATALDGANRFKQTIHVTLPSVLPITIVVATLALGNILNAGFDQIFNLYNPLVYSTGDIIDTYVYRQGLLGGQFGFATAVGLFKSVVGLILVLIGFRMAYKWADYKIV